MNQPSPVRVLVELLAAERCSMQEIMAATGRGHRYIRGIVSGEDVPGMKRGGPPRRKSREQLQ